MSYYKEQIPSIVEKCKTVMMQCLKIIDQPIDEDLSDDKLHSALKGKRMAAEDAKWYAREVDVLNAELNDEEVEKQATTTNPAKRYSRK